MVLTRSTSPAASRRTRRCIYRGESRAQGVMPALDLLDRSRRGERVDLGQKALVIGGGDTAMDATRTAQRLTGNP